MIYGAKASVYIKYEKDIYSLGEKLEKEFLFSKFCYENDEYPPYEVLASAGLLGFEIWLQKADKHQKYNYILEMQTTHSHDEIFNNKIHDLSQWLARYLNQICELEVDIEQPLL